MDKYLVADATDSFVASIAGHEVHKIDRVLATLSISHIRELTDGTGDNKINTQYNPRH
jgi:hypothetical protein